MNVVYQYNELRDKWDRLEFDTHTEAVMYVTAHVVIGWQRKHIYLDDNYENSKRQDN